MARRMKSQGPVIGEHSRVVATARQHLLPIAAARKADRSRGKRTAGAISRKLARRDVMRVGEHISAGGARVAAWRSPAGAFRVPSVRATPRRRVKHGASGTMAVT